MVNPLEEFLLFSFWYSILNLWHECLIILSYIDQRHDPINAYSVTLGESDNNVQMLNGHFMYFTGENNIIVMDMNTIISIWFRSTKRFLNISFMYPDPYLATNNYRTTAIVYIYIFKFYRAIIIYLEKIRIILQ